MKTIEEFRCFFKALMCSPKGKNQQYAPVIAGYIILLGGLYFSSGLYTFNNGWAAIVTALGGILFLAGAMVGISLNNKPNIATLLPISRKNSLTYRFLSVMVLWIFAIAVIIAIILAVGLVVMIIMAIVNAGLNVKDVAGETEEEITYAMGAYGGLFSLIYFLLMYSASILTGFIKSRKRRNMFLICFTVALFGAILLTGTPYYVHNSDGKFASPFISVCYESMKLPWLCIIFWFIAVAALFGAAIYLGIKKLKNCY